MTKRPVVHLGLSVLTDERPAAAAAPAECALDVGGRSRQRRAAHTHAAINMVEAAPSRGSTRRLTLFGRGIRWRRLANPLGIVKNRRSVLLRL
jgi:hypothetical protein